MLVTLKYDDKTTARAKRVNTAKVSQSHLDKLTKARAIAELFPSRHRADVVQSLMRGAK